MPRRRRGLVLLDAEGHAVDLDGLRAADLGDLVHLVHALVCRILDLATVRVPADLDRHRGPPSRLPQGCPRGCWRTQPRPLFDLSLDRANIAEFA